MKLFISGLIFIFCAFRIAFAQQNNDDDFLLLFLPRVIESQPTNECKLSSLTLPGRTYDCGLSTSDARPYYIDDSQLPTCAVKIVEGLSAAPLTQIRFDAAEQPFNPGPDSSTLFVSVSMPDDDLLAAIECSTLDVQVPGRSFSSRLFAIPNRTPYQVSGSLTASGTTITISDVILTPQ